MAAELSAASKVLQVCDDVAKQSVSGVDSWLRDTMRVLFQFAVVLRVSVSLTYFFL